MLLRHLHGRRDGAGPLRVRGGHHPVHPRPMLHRRPDLRERRLPPAAATNTPTTVPTAATSTPTPMTTSTPTATGTPTNLPLGAVCTSGTRCASGRWVSYLPSFAGCGPGLFGNPYCDTFGICCSNSWVPGGGFCL